VAEGDVDGLADALRGLEGVTDTRVMDGTVQLTATGAEGLLPRVLARAEAGGARVRDLSIDVPTLETVFINLTGKDLRE
jgi:ABC-2 type transport system ATP-binding protein